MQELCLLDKNSLYYTPCGPKKIPSCSLGYWFILDSVCNNNPCDLCYYI